MDDDGYDAQSILIVLQGLCLSGKAVPSAAAFTKCFRNFSRLCFGSVATQAELAETDASSKIAAKLFAMVSVFLDSESQSNSQITADELAVLETGMVAITALVSGGNASVNQIHLARCLGNAAVDASVYCLMLAMNLLLQRKAATLPPISGPNVSSAGSADISADALFALVESSLRLIENLLLHHAVRQKLISEYSCCELLTACLREVGPQRASVAEHSLSAMSNLLSRPEEAWGTPDGAGRRIVRAGACEGVACALICYAGDDVAVGDCACFLLQSLAAQDADALARLQSMRCATTSNSAVSRSGMTLTTRLAVEGQLLGCNLGSDGIVALLLRVLRSQYKTSITVVESAVGAIGALVLQSNLLMLQLLGNGGLQLLLSVLEAWGAASSGIAGKCIRVLTAATEMVRLCKRELSRVNSYYDGGSASSPPATLAQGSAGFPPVPSQRGDVEASLFEDDEEDAVLVRDIDVGVEGATPALVFQALDRVDVCSILMDAENGVLEKELSRHEGSAARRRITMGSAGSLAMVAMKVKSFKNNISKSGKEQPAAQHSASTPALPRLVMSALTAHTREAAEPASESNHSGTDQSGANSSSVANLKQALARAATARSTLQLKGEPSTSTAAVLPPASHAVAAHKQDEPAADPLFVLALKMLAKHGAVHMEVLHPTLKLLLTLCEHSAFPYHWVQISNHGGCATLVKALGNHALRRHGDGGESVAHTCELALQVLLQLAQCNLETHEKLRQLHAHTIVVDFLHHHGTQSLLLCELAAAQLFVMLYSDVSAKEANEGNPTACRTTVELLLHYGTQHMPFAEGAVCMLKTLTLYPPNRRLLAEKGGLAVLVNLIRSYTLAEAGPRSAKIALYGLATLAHLAGLEENQSRIAKSGGCKLVVELLRAYGRVHEVVAAEGLSAVSALGMSNRGMLGEVGACEEVVALLRHYITDPGVLNDNIALVASVAIFNLCSQYPENKQRFVQLQVMVDLRKILLIRQLSYSAREAVKDAVNIVCF